MVETVRALLHAVVDYAGTFPPAKLELADALASYARARAGKHAWMLGRCVFPASLLGEFERLAPSLVGAAGGSKDPPLQKRGDPPPPMPLSLIAKGEPGEREMVQRFNAENRGRAVVAALEFPPLSVAEIDHAARQAPEGVELFFEVPLGPDFEARVAAVASRGARVKIRTGGVVANAFPDAAELVRCMRVCANSPVAFKASAGLHHAVCGRYALTYEVDSPLASMYGFLNICVAATLVHMGAPDETAVDALREGSANAFVFTPGGLVWRDRTLAVTDLADARRSFFRSFGSCAFSEPVEDLERMGVI
jgi:hypothetical protein